MFPIAISAVRHTTRFFLSGWRTAPFALLLALAGAISTGQILPSEIIVRSLSKPGAIEIVNAGASDMSLRGALVVERKRDGAWIETPVVFQAIEACNGTDAPECVHLAPGARIRPIPWNGYTCSGQCTRPCRSNHYNGPGEFRFVVLSCDRAHRYVSQPFQLGSAPPQP